MNNGQQIPHVYEFGPFRLDAQERTLSREGEPVKLTPKLIDTLLVLVARNNHIVEKEQLMEVVWPGTYVEESNLSSNVSLLRKALGVAPDGQPYIETIPTRGYRFAAEVTERTDAAATVIVRRRTTARMVTSEETENLHGAMSPAPLELQPSQSIVAADTQAIAARSTSPRWAFGKVAMIFVVALLLPASVLLVWLSRRAKPPANASEVKTVAILPFREIRAPRTTTAKSTWGWGWPTP